jgi:hypothetical protein
MADASTPLRSPPATQGSSEDAEDLFRFPWPGPGNSEGPVDPDSWLQVEGNDVFIPPRGKALSIDPVAPERHASSQALPDS